MSKIILGIDLGTSSCKAVAFSETGKKLFEAIHGYDTRYPKTNWVEQNPIELWEATRISINKILSEGGISPENVIGIGVSSQAPTITPVDSDGNPVRDALLYADKRSEKECVEIREKFGEKELIKITGNRVNPFYGIGKILWMKKKRKSSI